jgi:hypothetical protein
VEPLKVPALALSVTAFETKVLHPELQREPVVRELFRSIGVTVLSTQKNTLKLALNAELSLDRSRLKPTLVVLHDKRISDLRDSLAALDSLASNTDVFGAPIDLNYENFLSFAGTLRAVTLEASARPDAAGSNAFNRAFTNYFQQYFKGQYVDRFGKPVQAPTSLQTISDNEISGTIQVFLDLVMDYALQTPVWYDKSNNYFPGVGNSSKNKPTVVVVGQMTNGGMPLQLLPLLDDDHTESCGITKLKAEAIQYIAQTAGTRASAWGGEVGGSFGGINVGLGVLGKFSLGDNKTIHSIVTTTLSEIFTRAGEEASYRLLYVIAYKKNDTLADLLEKYLEAQLKLPSS